MRLIPFTFGLLAVGLSAAVAGCSPALPEKPAADASSSAVIKPVPSFPAGDYRLDKSHASLTFSVNHLGFSGYTAGFDDFDVRLSLDPQHPEAAKVTATVVVTSLDLPTPPKGFHDTLMSAQWFDAAKYPQMQFVSTRVEVTGADTAKVHGDLTLHGVTKPVVLDARFNGGYPGFAPYDPNARVGFSLSGALKRSEFGLSYGIPEPDTTMGVGDEVSLRIEAELTGPALKS